MSRVHTIPLNDLKPHLCSIACACNPTIKDVQGGQLVAHNSYDGREFLRLITRTLQSPRFAATTPKLTVKAFCSA